MILNTQHLAHPSGPHFTIYQLLLTWISRVWMLAHRGFMNEDPVVFAARDRISLALAALTVVVFWVAS